jgi:lysophospholipase L1-like esterase
MLQNLILLSLFIFIVIVIFAQSKPDATVKQYTYLALGDSYTIGEGVPVFHNFPGQTIQLLRNKGIDINAPEILAQTGWTTDELQKAMETYLFSRNGYDLVTLLIGVNNQYRGYPAGAYEAEFEALLHRAVTLARNQPGNVTVLSIPDWSVTPFAEGRDRNLIRKEIDDFNRINKKIATANQVHYLDITPGTREAASDPSLIAADGLHPSEHEYAKWAASLSRIFPEQL